MKARFSFAPGRALAVGLAATALAVASWGVTHRVSDVPLGVVVITLDTTRADRLSPYGFMNVSLPHLERLAREGVVFDQAATVAPLTLPAHASLFTGLLPPNHGVRDNADDPLGESQTTLAEILSASGFHTGAFVGSMVLAPDRGLAQGFERYIGVGSTQRAASMQRPADEVVTDAIEWLDAVHGAPFFLWAHLYDAHRPYDPPEPYRSRYGHDPYLGEIAFADAQIGRLLDALAERQVLDRVVLVVAGDHGESLGAHGERDHGIFVYEEVLHVPLIVRAPSLHPLRVGPVVRLTDVLPTVLELLDIQPPPVDGVSLVAAMRGGRPDLDLEAYAESLYPARLGWSPLRSLRSGRFKFIEAPRPELYDLERDPFEQENIYGERRETAEAMTARLSILARADDEARAEGRQTHVAPEVRARLAALGYVSAGTVGTLARRTDLPDPKDCLDAYSRGREHAAGDPRCGPGLPPRR